MVPLLWLSGPLCTFDQRVATAWATVVPDNDNGAGGFKDKKLGGSKR